MAIKPFSSVTKLGEKLIRLTGLAPASDGTITTMTFLLKCKLVTEVESMFNALSSVISAQQNQN